MTRTEEGARSLLPTSFHQPPADLPPDRRGARATLAGVAMALALVVGWLSGATESGSTGGRAGDLEYRLDGPDWVGPAFTAVVLALALAAVLLWAARSHALFLIALTLLPVALGAAVLAGITRHTPSRISEVRARAVPIGASERELTHSLGAPAGHGELRRKGQTSDCLVYVGKGPDWDRSTSAFCFRDGSLASRRFWP